MEMKYFEKIMTTKDPGYAKTLISAYKTIMDYYKEEKDCIIAYVQDLLHSNRYDKVQEQMTRCEEIDSLTEMLAEQMKCIEKWISDHETKEIINSSTTLPEPAQKNEFMIVLEGKNSKYKIIFFKGTLPKHPSRIYRTILNLGFNTAIPAWIDDENTIYIDNDYYERHKNAILERPIRFL